MSEFFTKREIVAFESIDKYISENVLSNIVFQNAQQKDMLSMYNKYHDDIKNAFLKKIPFFGYQRDNFEFMFFKYIFSSHVCYKHNKNRKSLTQEDFMESHIRGPGFMHNQSAVYAAIFFKVPFTLKSIGKWVNFKGQKYVVITDINGSRIISWIYSGGILYRNKIAFPEWWQEFDTSNLGSDIRLVNDPEMSIIYNNRPADIEKAAIISMGRKAKTYIDLLLTVRTLSEKNVDVKIIGVSFSKKTFKFKFKVIGQYLTNSLYEELINGGAIKVALINSYMIRIYRNLIDISKLNFIIEVE